ncbi:kinase domain protein [Ancylostoma caninum]|uniref:Serine/threonine-protein kinase receptor n=1 Tax=Ancylostoma caninum TaxID=29170 RepID=A0A368HCS2_ANCCA|nr:kinase domain protein [Ancylostoma caninum]
MKPSYIYLTNSCGTIVLLFQVLLSISFAHELTVHNSSTFDVDTTTISTTLIENGSNPHSSLVAERIARGNAILEEMKSHIFGTEEQVHESDLICNCNGALCDNELVHLLGDSYRGKCRAKRGRCFKVYDQQHNYHMSVGCVDHKDLFPVPIFCLGHPNYHMTCCNYSFCDEEISLNVVEGITLEDAIPWHWVLIGAFIFLGFVAVIVMALLRHPRVASVTRKYLRLGPTMSAALNHISPREDEVPMIETMSQTTTTTAPAIQLLLLKGLESTDAGSGSGSGLPLLTQRNIARQIELVREIGQGRFGDVWLGAWKGDMVAVKIFSSRDEGSWSHEVETFQTHMLRHPNILQFYASDSKDTGTTMQLWLITEYHSHGSLFDYLSNSTVNVVTLVQMVRGISNGLSFLHTELMGIQKKPAIAHRDIKSKNILVKADLTCAIADLGLAVRYESGHISLPNSNKCGTVRYLPPEILEEKVESTRFEFYRMGDMYAIGLVIWEIARRTTCSAGPASPFAESLPYYDLVSRDPTIKEMREVVVTQGVRPYESYHWRENNVLRDVSRVMRECWSANPSSRLTAMNVRLSMDRLAQTELNLRFS